MSDAYKMAKIKDFENATIKSVGSLILILEQG